MEYLETLVKQPVINDEAAHFLYDERKIDPRVVKWCGLTSIDRPMPCWRWGKAFYDAPSLLIPYRDVDGKLLTVQERKLSPLLTSPGGENSPLLTSPGGGTENALSAEESGRGNLTLPPGGDGGGLPRFRFPRGSHVGMYNKPVIRRLREGDELWITEGPSDCWAMLSAGHKAVAIPSATSLTREDIGVLRNGLPEGFKDFGQWYANRG